MWYNHGHYCIRLGENCNAVTLHNYRGGHPPLPHIIKCSENIFFCESCYQSLFLILFLHYSDVEKYVLVFLGYWCILENAGSKFLYVKADYIIWITFLMDNINRTYISSILIWCRVCVPWKVLTPNQRFACLF